MRIAIIVTAILLAAACAVDEPPRDGVGPHVSVQGEARIEVTPDRLSVRARVTSTAAEIVDATSSVDSRTAAALDAARDAGLDDRDIRSLAVTIQPVWDWRNGERVFRGHEATRVIELTVRDIDAWPGLLAALIDARVDRIDSVEADHSERDGLMREALQEAVADARARADLLADAAGTRVDGVYSITEASRGWTQPSQRDAVAMRAQQEAMPAPEAFEPGVITITSNVEAVYQLRMRRAR